MTAEVAAVAPVIVALAEVHVGMAAALAGPVTTHWMLTAPVNPPNGVTVMATLVEAPELAIVTL